MDVPSPDAGRPEASLTPVSGPIASLRPSHLTPGVFAAAQKSVTNEELATNRKRLITAYGIATFLIPGFAVADFLSEMQRPEETQVTIALVVRAVAMTVIGAGFLRVRFTTVIGERELDFWVNFLAPFLSTVISLLCLTQSGVDSPYAGAANLVATGYAFVPRRWTKVVVSGIATVVLYPATFLVCSTFWERARLETLEPRFALDLAIETSIVGATVLVLASAAHMLWSLRREVFAARSIGRYRAVRRLGRGGMGEVWSAFDQTLKRYVALKVLRIDSPDVAALSRFEREVRATIELTHPNTVRVLDVGVTDDGLSYYAMELLEGEPLSTLMRRESPLDAARAVHFALQAARALAEAHARGIVHRDVKPENLFVTKAGDETDFLKVLDFGIARLDHGGSTELTQTGMIAGTPHYLAPEVIEGRDAGPAADVYALGVVLYELLSGRSPYGDAEGSALLLAHISMPAEPLSKHVQVPAALEAIVVRCLAKTPRLRYPTARELADALFDLPFAQRWRPLPDRVSAPFVSSGRPSVATPDAETVVASKRPPPPDVGSP